MSGSKGRKGGMNFHPRQLTVEWKPKEEREIVVPKPLITRGNYNKTEEK
jgi:hypothetical protein